jgi:hypothetical protein
MQLPSDGGCRCGALRIRVTKPPLMTAACHCPGCQRMSASAFSLTAICLADSLEVTQGQPVIGGARSDDTRHFFCTSCMTWTFTRLAAFPQVVNVRPTMFDDHTWFSPFMETYTRTKLPWAATGALHSFEEFPPMQTFGALTAEYAARLGLAP